MLHNHEATRHAMSIIGITCNSIDNKQHPPVKQQPKIESKVFFVIHIFSNFSKLYLGDLPYLFVSFILSIEQKPAMTTKNAV